MAVEVAPAHSSLSTAITAPDCELGTMWDVKPHAVGVAP